MAWFGLDRLFLGTSLSAEQQRSQQLDQQLNSLNQQLTNAGYHDQNYTDAAAADIAQAGFGYWQDNGDGTSTWVVDNHGSNPTQSVDQGFVEGAQQGLQNVLNAPGAVIGAVGRGSSTLLGGILKNIPWWVYVVGAFLLFAWLGGLKLLKGSLAR